MTGSLGTVRLLSRGSRSASVSVWTLSCRVVSGPGVPVKCERPVWRIVAWPPIMARGWSPMTMAALFRTPVSENGEPGAVERVTPGATNGPGRR